MNGSGVVRADVHGASKDRAWFGATALVVLFGVIVQLFVASGSTEGFFGSSTDRVLNDFAHFTIQSNLIVGVTSALLALDPTRTSTAFSVLRLTGVVAIAITGIVYHSVLRGLFDLRRWGLMADTVVHTIVPGMAIVGWLVFGPRGRTSGRIAVLSVMFPTLWLAFTLIGGAIVGFYPYPFIDVTRIGYPRALVNCVWVAVLYLGVAGMATAFDGWLARIGVAVRAAERADPNG